VYGGAATVGSKRSGSMTRIRGALPGWTPPTAVQRAAMSSQARDTTRFHPSYTQPILGLATIGSRRNFAYGILRG